MNNKNNDCPIAVRFSLDEINELLLHRCLTAWNNISGGDGCYDYSSGYYGIFNRPGILLPSSLIILVDGENPLGYIYAWVGNGFGVYGRKNFVGRSLGDLPDRSYAETMGGLMKQVINEKRVTYHRVEAVVDGTSIKYQRLILPLIDRGEVTGFVTTAVSPQFRRLGCVAKSGDTDHRS